MISLVLFILLQLCNLTGMCFIYSDNSSAHINRYGVWILIICISSQHCILVTSHQSILHHPVLLFRLKWILKVCLFVFPLIVRSGTVCQENQMYYLKKTKKHMCVLADMLQIKRQPSKKKSNKQQESKSNLHSHQDNGQFGFTFLSCNFQFTLKTCPFRLAIITEGMMGCTTNSWPLTASYEPSPAVLPDLHPMSNSTMKILTEMLQPCR